MTGNIEIKDDDEIESLLNSLQEWSDDLFGNDWNSIENSGSTSSAYYTREKNLASERNYERHLIIEKLREKLLCRG